MHILLTNVVHRLENYEPEPMDNIIVNYNLTLMLTVILAFCEIFRIGLNVKH